MKVKILFFIIATIFFQGCSMQVGLLNPKPKLDIPKSDQSLQLIIDNAVKNSYLIPEYSGIKNSKVTNWRASLKNGFDNGFNNFYKIRQNNTNSDFILKLSQADLKFIPASLSGYNNTTVLNVEIKFKAVLLNNNDEKLNSIDDIAVSEKTINVKGQEADAVGNAIENMYQTIAIKMFKQVKNMWNQYQRFSHLLHKN